MVKAEAQDELSSPRGAAARHQACRRGQRGVIAGLAFLLLWVSTATGAPCGVHSLDFYGAAVDPTPRGAGWGYTY